MQLDLPHLVLCFNWSLFSLSLKLFCRRGTYQLSDLTVLSLVFVSNLIEFNLFLFQLHFQFVLNLQQFSILSLLKCPSIVFRISSKLFVKLLDTAFNIFVSILLHLFNIWDQLHPRALCFEKLVVFYFSFLLAHLNLLFKRLLDLRDSILLLLLYLNFLVCKLLHNPSFHLFSLDFNVFPGELLMLEKSELFSLLHWTDLFSDSTLSIAGRLLPKCLQFPLERIDDFIDLLFLGPFKRLFYNL